MRIRLPWVTLTGTPDGPRLGAKLRCLGAMLAHEAVEIMRGSERAHAMPAAERYGFLIAIGAAEGAAVAGEAAAAGGAEAAAAGEAGAAEAGTEGAAAEAEAGTTSTGQTHNLNSQQFFQPANLKFPKGMIAGMLLGPEVNLPPREDFDEPGHTS